MNAMSPTVTVDIGLAVEASKMLSVHDVLKY